VSHGLGRVKVTQKIKRLNIMETLRAEGEFLKGEF